MKALRVVHRNALVYRRIWRGTTFFSFVQPALFLGAMGWGLGSLINARSPNAFGGFNYLEFVGPGLLAASCMQMAMFESTFPVLSKITWQRNYEAMLATPLKVRDVVVGEISWIALRVATMAAAFLAVLTVFQIPRSPLAILAIPSAILTGIAFGSAVMSYTATRNIAGDFNMLFRFIMLPLFLFSGTFFRLPQALRPFAFWTPLYHGVELSRGLVLGTIGAKAAIGHLAYLFVFLAIGLSAAYLSMKRRLVK